MAETEVHYLSKKAYDRLWAISEASSVCVSVKKDHLPIGCAVVARSNKHLIGYIRSVRLQSTPHLSWNYTVVWLTDSTGVKLQENDLRESLVEDRELRTVKQQDIEEIKKDAVRSTVQSN